MDVVNQIFAIFAFSTCGSYSGMFKMSVECKNRSDSDLGIEGRIRVSIQVYFDAPTCKGGSPDRLFLVGDYSSSAEFFVTIGVFSFLYSMAALSGLSDVKAATDPDRVITFIPACEDQENRCRESYEPKVSGLNTSVAFGFINLILWAGNLWFVFKETGWMAAFAGTYAPSQEKQPAPDSFAQGDYAQQDPYAGSQGGYQPDYGQQSYNEGGEYSQGYEQQQQQPTSYSNQIQLEEEEEEQEEEQEEEELPGWTTLW
ncbi:hypothetical protein CRUP_027595, partial [Coryphaenoides rupestris]